MHIEFERTYIDKPSLIYIRDQKLLMARSKGQDLFYIPGGKREGDETAFDCLVREAKEELGVDLIRDSMKSLFVIEAPAHNKPEGVFVRFDCIAGDINGEPSASSEIEELRFLDSNDYALTPEAGVLILKELQKRGLID